MQFVSYEEGDHLSTAAKTRLLRTDSADALDAGDDDGDDSDNQSLPSIHHDHHSSLFAACPSSPSPRSKTLRRPTCLVCGASFSTVSNLNVHMRDKHDPAYQGFGCVLCGAQFKRRWSCKRHEDRCRRRRARLLDKATKQPKPVSQTRPKVWFLCQWSGCTKKFTRKSNLIRHIDNVHRKLRPHQCDLCNSQFGQISTLRRHQFKQHAIDHTLESPSPANQNPVPNSNRPAAVQVPTCPRPSEYTNTVSHHHLHSFDFVPVKRELQFGQFDLIAADSTKTSKIDCDFVPSSSLSCDLLSDPDPFAALLSVLPDDPTTMAATAGGYWDY